MEALSWERASTIVRPVFRTVCRCGRRNVSPGMSDAREEAALESLRPPGWMTFAAESRWGSIRRGAEARVVDTVNDVGAEGVRGGVMSELNGVMMQYFHWYVPADGTLWEEAASRAASWPRPASRRVWLPPAYKGTGGGYDVGYGVYDMYDLGEFDQKGSCRTKYGTREQYLAAVRALRTRASRCTRTRCSTTGWAAIRPSSSRPRPSPRTTASTPAAICGRSWPTPTSISPAGRASTPPSSGMPRHFDAVDYDARRPGERNTVYLLEGKTFDDEVALERGNFAFLMGCDLDFQSEEVRREVTDWGKWYLDTTGVDGFRLDAVKHIAAWFFPEWLDAMEKHAGQGLVRGGRVLDPRAADTLRWYLDRLGGRMSVFAVPLHYHFHYASRAGGGLRHAPPPGRLPHAGPRRPRRDLRGQPRLAAPSGPRVHGRALVQAARLCPHPAPARGLSLRLLPRLLRGQPTRTGAETASATAWSCPRTAS